ncbi:MAG: hypothetical protein Q7S22_07400 [Candidatus Micrarchaeota archaeon]|nr:hypothetical protein [Candidatus Micrarchaeota archaeon]
MELDMRDIEKILMKREEQFDKVHVKTREIVRSCSNAIKSIHSKEMDAAAKYLATAEKEISEIANISGEFPDQLNHILQEYVEAKIVLSAVQKKKIPSFKDMGVNEISYLNGLLDATGELKREMYEALRHKDKKLATQYFEMMEEIYSALLPLRFSNAVLPEFRRKQDVARIQLEQARGELL